MGCRCVYGLIDGCALREALRESPFDEKGCRAFDEQFYLYFRIHGGRNINCMRVGCLVGSLLVQTCSSFFHSLMIILQFDFWFSSFSSVRFMI